jgi:hypothetical protein
MWHNQFLGKKSQRGLTNAKWGKLGGQNSTIET